MKYVNVVNNNGDIGDNFKEKVTDFKFMDDLNKWPVINDKLRLYLIQCEPKQKNLKKCPTNDNGKSFSIFHYFRCLLKW